MESTREPSSQTGPTSHPNTSESSETLEQTQARHRGELRDLQNRITSKKKGASKKTRRGIDHECESMDRDLRDKQAVEVAALVGTSLDKESRAPTPELAHSGPESQTELDRSGGQPEVDSASYEPKEPAQQQQQQQQGKKRNRQRERLARRAAEQEAAATEAEKEAANMVDKRKIESAHMKAEAEANGLRQVEIRPDGHCLFAAVADQLAHTSIPLSSAGVPSREQPPYRIVRKRAASFLLGQAAEFSPFLETSVEKHAGIIRDTAEWGGHVELMALARAYDVEIRVVQEGRTERINEGAEKVIWLAYYRHGYGLGEHYNSLRRL